MDRIYMCIDLKSFYASVECRERNLDPLTTNLVVADGSRTEKTVCLAVSPSLKQYGIGGRARLFEVISKVKEINYKRKVDNSYKKFIGKSYNDIELKNNKSLELDYIVAPPRMAKYIKYSTEIYNTYLKYISAEDIFVYSIDEVFCDVTSYLKLYKMSPVELITMMIKDVYDTTGITATGGIGTNMFLAKVAMDVVAKHEEANEYGVRIAYLDEKLYREKLWDHKPMTDIWRVGKGTMNRLSKYGIYTMGDICRCSLNNENLLYKLFGVNAELLIDHAWGYEPCTMEEVKKYKPSVTSLSSGQVLHSPYNYEKTRLVIKEMMDNLSLDLVSKHFVTKQITLTLMYDRENLTNPKYSNYYDGEIVIDQYGREVPKSSHGTYNLKFPTSLTSLLTEGVLKLYDRIVNKNLVIRKINITVNDLQDEDKVINNGRFEQIDIFSNDVVDTKEFREKEKKEKDIQKALISIKDRFGKNAILKVRDLEEGATMKDRNSQIGGHHE